jgi:hypothetical protein
MGDGQPDDGERELSTLFKELRDRDQENAPPFAATWARAATRVRQKTVWKPVAVGGFGLVGAAAALLTVFGTRDAPQQATAYEVGLPDPEPLAFLLSPTGFDAVEVTVSFDSRPYRYQLDEILEAAQKGEPL